MERCYVIWIVNQKVFRTNLRTNSKYNTVHLDQMYVNLRILTYMIKRGCTLLGSVTPMLT